MSKKKSLKNRVISKLKKKLLSRFRSKQKNNKKRTNQYKLKSFDDTWACWEFITDHKVELLAPHLIDYGDEMTGFEFYCESRYGEEV